MKDGTRVAQAYYIGEIYNNSRTTSEIWLALKPIERSDSNKYILAYESALEKYVYRLKEVGDHNIIVMYYLGFLESDQ